MLAARVGLFGRKDLVDHETDEVCYTGRFWLNPKNPLRRWRLRVKGRSQHHGNGGWGLNFFRAKR